MSASSRVVAASRIISAARSHRRTCRNGSRSRIRIAASTRMTRWNAAARRCGAAATQASSSGCYCSFDGARPCDPARNTFRKKAGHEHMAKSGRLKLSQHLRQIRADRAAWISVAARPLAGAIGGHVIREGENLFTATVPHQEISEPVSARMSAFRGTRCAVRRACPSIGEDDRAIGGHVGTIRFAS
jgi:hypothetical protein